MLKITVDKLTENVQFDTDVKDFVLTFESIRNLITAVNETQTNPGEVVTFELFPYKPAFSS